MWPSLPIPPWQCSAIVLFRFTATWPGTKHTVSIHVTLSHMVFLHKQLAGLQELLDHSLSKALQICEFANLQTSGLALFGMLPS